MLVINVAVDTCLRELRSCSYFLTSFYDMVTPRNTISFIVSTNERYRFVYLHIHLTVLGKNP